MINLIAAIQKSDRGLGYKNELLYRVSDDLKRFKEMTTGHPIIMGRKTFESIGRALPNRTNIVITSQKIDVPGIITVLSDQEAFNIAKKSEGSNQIFIIGGARVYEAFMTVADQLFITIIEGNKTADVFFPTFEQDFKEISREKHVDANTSTPYSYVTLVKNS